MSSAIYAPIWEPIKALITANKACFQGINPLRASRHVASVVPIEELNLFVPIARCTGIPVNKYPGREINPPPPAMASTKPAKNTRGQTIKYLINSLSIYTITYPYNIRYVKSNQIYGHHSLCLYDSYTFVCFTLLHFILIHFLYLCISYTILYIQRIISNIFSFSARN